MDLQRLHGAVEAAHDSLPEKARGTWMARAASCRGDGLDWGNLVLAKRAKLFK
jgi:hypothetical protein